MHFLPIRMYQIRFVVGILVVIKCAESLKNEDDSIGSPRDSYLNAYAVTKQLNKKSDVNGYFPQDIHSDFDDNGFDHPYYEHPKPIYGPPKPIYGTPAPHPPPNYGPYPPATPPNYGPPEPFIPYSLIGGILDKIKYKFDLLTIGKIILKLVIFKKIVSFIGILCLLLFLPSLKKKHINNNHNGEDDELMRSFNTRKGDVSAQEKINNVTTFVMESIEAFSKKHNDTNCQSIYCKSQTLRKYIDNTLTYGRLAELYSKEL